MEIQEILCSQTGDKCNYIKHPSGLDIYICEMNGFSNNRSIIRYKIRILLIQCSKQKQIRNIRSFRRVLAHFLEHKLFENEDCDAFAQYGQNRS